MSRSSRAQVAMMRFRVLSFLFALCRTRPRGVSLSFRRMVRELGSTEGRVRGALRWLEAEELIRVSARYAEDGGQQPNVYFVSVKGRAALRAAELEGSLEPFYDHAAVRL